MHIVEMLGTAPKATGLMESASFLVDVTSMSLVCRRWNKVVRSTYAVWKSVCDWRWDWLTNVWPLYEDDMDQERDKSRWLNRCLKMAGAYQRQDGEK